MHAIRWASRKTDTGWRYTKWHLAKNANTTLCNLPIRIAIDGGSFLPETNDDLEMVECKRCGIARRHAEVDKI